jgi:hypothetical protein
MARPLPQVISALRADPAVQAIVGQRVYADNPPQDDELPFVVISVLTTQLWGTLDYCNVRMYVARLQLDAICKTRGDSEAVMEAIEDLLDGYTSTDAQYPIQGIVVDSGVSWDIVTPIDGSDERGYHSTQDFQLNYKRL